ncbi:U-box domain-containing protein 33-like isoform X2 [Hordeum vulgare subsp. vulgare]|uniref:RING-type E3 ubiquitin transferase n=1 Tax=Hordeum vulgare subsp. vulgare TaxID=112509 RepID=A0A8I7BC61_HORVV|nr:U-box domain-containing protein 33-like isoform X2 [Hordeum vulgare subsp. vulgare]
MELDDSDRETFWSAQRSLSSSTTGDEPDGQSYPGAEGTVFVALADDANEGVSTLLWAMKNLAKDGSRVVIAHVRSPIRSTHRTHHGSMRPEEVSDHRNLEWDKAGENMAKPARRDLEIDCEEVVIEMDDVAEGLAQLIAIHGITRLVMGAAADQHYSKEMKIPKSKTALKLMETAAPSCKIWFICDGHLICTREINENLPAISWSPVESTTTSSVCSISSQMRSMALKNEEASSKGYNSGPSFESQMGDWDFLFGDDAVGTSGATTLPVIISDARQLRPVKHSPTYEADGVYLVPECNMEETLIVDEEVHFGHQEVYTVAELWKGHDESNKHQKAARNLLSALQRAKVSEDSYLHEVNQRKQIEEILTIQRLEIDEMKRRRYALHDELQDSKKQKLILEKHIIQTETATKDNVKEITDFFTEKSSKETKKCLKLEMDQLSALQKAREMENLYQNEKGQRLDMDAKITGQRVEIEETKKHRDELYYELKDLKEHMLRLKIIDVPEETNRRRRAERDLLSALEMVKGLEHRILREMRKRKAVEEANAIQSEEIQAMIRQLEDKNAKYMSDMKSALKFHEEELEKSKHFIQEIQAKYDKSLRERDTAVTEAKELWQKNKHGALVFSLSELQQATKCFDVALKIGEGGSGRVYKGFLRNTTVAIKLLHCQHLQGQQEFHQEVAFLSTVRHPNIMVFIGACQEASGSGLVHEFLPNGSLEEHISCKKKKNTPQLTWQMRTRIIGEIWSALMFIHSHKPLPIVHGDLKPDNILLDANFVSKLRICQVSKNPRATKNTKDPKFLTTGELTPQCDVYSFGIIILRLLTGRSLQNIIATVEKAMEKGHLHSIIDDSAGSWPYQQADQLARLGLRCANLSGKRRPDLIGGVWGVIEPLMKAASLNAGRPSFAASSDDTHTPSSFVCAISQEVMCDPQIAADGFTYEAEAIRRWLDSGHDTSPMTNLKLKHCNLTPNRALHSAILEWQQQQQKHGT